MTVRLSVIVPCYNESGTILSAIEQLQTLRDRYDLEIIVVDDGSTDGSFERLRGVEGIKLERHEKNRGKGAAVVTGLAKVTGDVVVIQDADLEYDPKEIPDLLDPILSGKCDIVYGSRFKGNITGMTFSHYVGNKILSFFTSLLYGAEVTDMMTGHKAFRSRVFKELTLKSSRFEFELEVTVEALRKGYSICEIPIPYFKRRIGQAKIGWADGFKTLLKLLEYRLGL
jgi:glycosyltransferase involved in cell wall biosynthesis